MSLIRIATANFLEGATVTVSTGAALADYPVSRLSDRNPSREHRATGAGSVAWTFHGTAASVNALILAAGHNLGGVAYTLERSSDGAAWTTAASGNFEAGAGVALVEFAAASYDWWRLTVASSAATLTELLLTSVYTCTHQADRESSNLGKVQNLQRDQTRAGSERFILLGPQRRRRTYEFLDVPEAMSDAVEGMTDALAGAKPFILCDHRGTWIFGNLLEPIQPQEVDSLSGVWKKFTIDFQETI